MRYVNLNDFANFINDYNGIGYGKAIVSLTKNKNLIITLHNAGFSENEDLEQQFVYQSDHKYYLIYDLHPVKIFLIRLNYLEISKRITTEEIEKFMKSVEIEKVDAFTHEIEIL